MAILTSLRNLVATIREDLRAHGGDPTKPGFQTLAVHRFGVYVHSLPRVLARKPLVAAYRAGYVFCRNFYSIELPYSAKVGRRVVIEHQGGIVVHGASEIGDDCILRQGVTLGNRHLSSPMDAPVLGNRVNVGAGAKILGAVRLGDGSAVGANAVVTRDVPAGLTAVGIPARPLLSYERQAPSAKAYNRGVSEEGEVPPLAPTPPRVRQRS